MKDNYRYHLQQIMSEGANMILVKYSSLINQKYNGVDVKDLDLYACRHLKSVIDYELDGYKERIVSIVEVFDPLLNNNEKRYLTILYDQCVEKVQSRSNLLEDLIQGHLLVKNFDLPPL